MRYWITCGDGSISYQCEAPDAGQAFEAMAKHLKYPSFAAFSADLGYSAGDFRIAIIMFESAEYDAAGNRKLIDQQRDNALLAGFKQLRRLGRG